MTILHDNHRRQLHESGIEDEWIKAEGIYSEDNIATLSAIVQKRYPKKCGPAMVIPFRDAVTGDHNGFRRLRPDNPRKERGRDRFIKYESPKGAGNRAYLPKPVIDKLPETSCELFITEGEKKSIAASYNGFPTIGLVGIYGWKPDKSKVDSLIPDLDVVKWNGRRVFIVFDSDAADKPQIVEAENRLAAVLTSKGAVVRIVRLPPAEKLDGCKADKIGLDDFLLHYGETGHVEFRKLADKATKPEPVDVSVKSSANDNDPADLARAYLKDECTTNGVCRLKFWRGQFWGWQGGRYQTIDPSDLTGFLWQYVDRRCFGIKQHTLSNMQLALSSLTLLHQRVEQPSWLSTSTPFPADEVLATTSALIHLPSLADGKSEFSVPPTPEFFSSIGVSVRHSPDSAEPVEWRKFLASVWPEDQQQIETLQEWFGYLLTADTRQQKILLLIGPKRSGKGTIGRVMQGLIGCDNVAGPTLAGLATNFGLWPLIGKSLAVIADARLSGRTDRAIVTERLLSISGEDTLTIDRKCLQPVTCKLPARLMLMTNEVPRLNDSSGALASRFIVLRMTKSFYGAEDHGLTDRLLAEMPGILNWAIEGWKRLYDRGHFVQPESSACVIADMAHITSPVSKFVEDWCVLDPQAEVSVSVLFDRWCEWCEEEKKKPGDKSMFGRDLCALLPELTKERPREGGKRIWKYSGIRLRSDADDIAEMEDEYVHGTQGGPSGPSTNGEVVLSDVNKESVCKEREEKRGPIQNTLDQLDHPVQWQCTRCEGTVRNAGGGCAVCAEW